MKTTWRVVSFDPAVPIDSLKLVLESDEPRTVELVEQAAHAWGVEIEREPEADRIHPRAPDGEAHR